MAGLLSTQGLFCLFFGIDATFYFYPLITHVPLILVLWLIQKNSLLWSILSVLTAYFCCQLRNCFGNIVELCFPQIPYVYYWVEIISTPVLFWFCHKSLASFMKKMALASKREQITLGTLPIIYYLYCYVTSVYTALQYTNQAVTNMMLTTSLIAFILYLKRFSLLKKQQLELETDQRIMNQQVEQSMRELQSMRDNQEQIAVLRHDLRHHLRYLLTCIENDETEDAKGYIHELVQDIDAQKVMPYCENESINLILSAFAGRCKKDEITFTILADVPQWLNIPNKHLNVIVFNALENAIHACDNLPKDKRFINVNFRQKQNKLLLQIENSYGEQPEFQDDLPITKRENHGIGVRSIASVVQQYGGIYKFSANDGIFSLKIAL